MLKEINSTFLCLIPKNIGVESLEQFKPISLFNLIYKIISKVPILRLLSILLDLILEQHNGFIPGRQILNSIIFVQENIHSLSLFNNQGFIMKVDIPKSYDRVEWTFLHKVLLSFGFNDFVTKLILQLVLTTSLGILVNGSFIDFCKSSRGRVVVGLISIFS